MLPDGEMALLLFCKIKIWALVFEKNVLNWKFYDYFNQYLIIIIIIIGLNKSGVHKAVKKQLRPIKNTELDCMGLFIYFSSQLTQLN